ncbi:MAG TPA: ABC transporter substrate-binding protein, partial [Candidatus Bathyarchaeia archaeon]|nr:ABC transporter substrate-binding protein [Candidatus Bathyarchaeia archaeon]
KDFGFNMPADTVWVSNRFMSDNPETVRAVVKGIQQAWVFTAEHPMNASFIMSSYLPEWEGQESILASDFAGDNTGLVNMTLVAEHGAGYMNPDVMKAGLENTYRIYDITSDLYLTNWRDIFTNTFIDPAIKPTSVPWT